MNVIALTGGIASGKSTASARFRELGAAVIDADQLARQAVEPGTGALAAIVTAFGASVLNPEGTLNRSALAGIIFSDDEARRKLNAITHPEIWRLASAAFADAERQGSQVVIYDIPLLGEATRQRPLRFDSILLVTAPLEERIRRMVEDRGMTHDEAVARLGAQLSDVDRRALADTEIVNDGTPEQLREKIDAFWATLPITE